MSLFENYYLGLFALVVINSTTYWFIREMIVSIVWCEIGGKYKKLKSYLSCNIINKILQNYDIIIIKYKKQFLFWIRLKRIYVFVEFVMTVLFMLSVELFKSLILCNSILLQSLIICFVIIFQFDSKKNTKYDRLRMKQ